MAPAPTSLEIGLCLGANLGDRLGQLATARRRLLALPGVSPRAQSGVYETEPVGVRPEYRHLAFLNAVLVVDCTAPLETFFAGCRAIEQELGRARSADRYAPRAIDIDVLYAGGLVRQEAHLTLPHPQWRLRRFVLAPLAEVRPELVLPGEPRPVRAVLAALPPGEAVHRLPEAW